MMITLKGKLLLLTTILTFCNTINVQAQLKKILFTPQWHANVQFAGYIAARELGYYHDEGLDVTIKYPEGTKPTLELLQEGKADIAMGFLMSAIILNANEGHDLVNVMQTSQHSSLCLALKKPMKNLSINNLHGLRVGLWNTQTAITASIMNNLNHLNWNIVPFRDGIKLLGYGVLDAISVMEYNELLRLKYTGRDVSEHSVFKMCEHGYDIPEEGVYCLRKYYQDNAETVKAFVRASRKGWEWCRKHPKETVEMVTKEMNKEYVSNSVVFQNAGLKVVLKKQEISAGKIGYTLQREPYEKAGKILLDAELIQTIPDFQTFVAQ